MFLRAGIFLCVLLATEGSAQDINITSFTQCTTNGSFNNPGVMCGTRCWTSGAWCHVGRAIHCDIGSEVISTADSRLCSNPEVWRGVDCSEYWSEGWVHKYGRRCTGQNMQCIYPWYTVYDGEERPWDFSSCTDNSDQIFEVNQTCRQHLQRHIDFHTKNFCNEKYSVQSKPICTNTTQWLSEQDFSINDPHNCQSSCSERGPDCLACTNSSYFLCGQSSKCIHPALVCDGHPHCLDRSDEDQCQNSSKSNLVLDVSSALVLLLFFELSVN